MKAIWRYWQCRNHHCVMSLQNEMLSIQIYKKKQNRISLMESDSFKIESDDSTVTTQLTDLQQKAALRFIKTEFILPLDKVRRTFVKFPENFEGIHDDWLHHKVMNSLPPGMQEKDIVWGYRLHRNQKLPDAALITIVHTNLIEKWQKTFAAANLRMGQFTGDCFSCIDTLDTVNPDFFTGKVGVVVITHKSLMMMLFNDADLADYLEISHSDVDINGSAEKLTELIGSWSLSKICLTDLNSGLSQDALDELGKRLQDNVTELKSEVSSDSIPLGIVIGDEMSLMETSDLRTGEFQFEMEEAEEKKNALFIGAGVIAVLAILFIATFSFRILAVSEHDDWQTQVGQMETRITQIEKLKQKQNSLIKELDSRKVMLGKRSQVAKDLFEVSRALPEDVWLRELRLGRFDDDFFEDGKVASEIDNILIQGLSLSETRIGRFLSNLEQSNYFEESILQFIQNIPREQVYKKTKLRRVPVSKFEIEVGRPQ